MSVVERRVTADELEGGYLGVSEREASLLGLPEFSGHVELSFAGEPAVLSWDARARRLVGEFVTDGVALEASIGSLLRWTRDGEALVLEVAMATSGYVPRWDGGFARPAWQATPPSAATPHASSAPRSKRRTPKPVARSRNRVAADFDWAGNVGIALESNRALHKALETGGWDDPESFRLRLRGERLACLGGFDELLGVAASAVEPMDHQIAAVGKALSVMRGRAILADEVGLGKTIEAGLILKELDLRGLASHVLIVTPATLREQWKVELTEKFGLDSTVITSSDQALDASRVIMSLELARRRRAELVQRSWDMVILDEAHRSAGPGAKATRELLEGLDSRYRLFLTATPVNNDLLELYRLVSLLRPGTFQSQVEFTRKFIKDGDKRSPRNAQDLRQLVSNVMIRTTREQAGLDKIRRHAVDVPVRLSRDELTAYELVVRLLREVLTAPTDRMRRDSLTRSLTMSPRGLYESAKQAAAQRQDPRTRLVLNTLAEIAADSGPCSRQRAANAITRRWLADSDKGRVIVFTQHTRVLNDLMRVLSLDGIPSTAYHGGMTAKAKHASLDAFRSDVRVLVSTDAGAEGLNLQHANAVINYDLPWNPMRIEQRIGRVHRVTQTRDVHIANLYSERTIDQHVYRILVDKLRMFEILFGQVTTILGELEDPSRGDLGGFEGQVKHALYAANDAEMARRLDALARSAGQARVRAEQQFQDQGGISSWLAPFRDHRATLERDRGELRPQSVTGVSQRGEESRTFVMDWLTSRGSVVEHQTRDLLSVRLPDDLRSAFGSDRLHLAFSPDSVHLHPEAELCLLGSPFFDELLATCAEHGDLLGWTLDRARIEAQPTALVPDHPDGWELKERRIPPVPIAGGTSHWLVADEDTRREAEIRTVTWGQHEPDPGTHVPYYRAVLGDEVDPLPLNLHGTASFTRRVLRDAVPALDAVRSEWESDLVGAHEEEVQRRVAFYQQQLDTWEDGIDRSRVRQSLERIQRETAPRMRVRCDLLALEVVSEATAEIEEVWRAPDGASVRVAGTYDARTGVLSLRDSRGAPVRGLAFCDKRHAVDAAVVAGCSGCGERACPMCPEPSWVMHRCGICSGKFCSRCQDATFRCALCERAACSSCSDDGLCQTCLLLEPVSESDLAALPDALALGGLRVLVGRDEGLVVIAAAGAQRREAIVVDAASSQVRRWVTLSAVDPGDLEAAIRFATQHHLTGDFVLGMERRAAGMPDLAKSALVVHANRRIEEEWSAPRAGTCGPRPHGPSLPIASPTAGQERVLEALVPACHEEGSPLLKSEVEKAVAVWLDADGVRTWQASGSTASQEKDGWGPWSPPDQNGQGAGGSTSVTTCRSPEWLTAHLERSRSQLVLRIVPQPALLGGPTERSALVSALTAMDEKVGPLAASQWLVGTQRLQGPASGDTSPLHLVRRELSHPEAASVRLVLGGDSPEVFERRRSPERAPSAAAPGGGTEDRGMVGESFGPGQDLGRPATLAAIEVVWPSPVPVTDTWMHRDGRTITVPGSWVPGDSHVVLRDPAGLPITTLGTCARGHPADHSAVLECGSCGRQACPACPQVEQVAVPCGVCSAPACRECLPKGKTCLLCGRDACAACRGDGDLCPACRGIEAVPVPPSEVPATLCAQGLSVTRSADAEVEVLRLVGGHRREVVLLGPGGAVAKWWTLAPTTATLLGQALAVVATSGLSGDIRPNVASIAAATPPPEPGSLEISTAADHIVRWRFGEVLIASGPNSKEGQGAEAGPRQPKRPLVGALDATTPHVAGEAVPCILETLERAERVRVTGEGLVRQTTVGQTSEHHLERWAKVSAGSRVGTPMPPEVEARAIASLPEGPRITLATLGESFRFLIVQDVDDFTVWDIDGAREHAEELAFGRVATGSWVPRRRVTPVATAIPWESVQGLARVPRLGAPTWSARPMGSAGPRRPLVAGDGKPARGDAEFVLPLPPVRPRRELPAVLLAGLDALVPRREPGQTESMDLLLEQPFTIAASGWSSTDVLTVTGVGPATCFVAPDGRTMTSPIVCTSGHAGEAIADQQCQYCGLIRCSRCAIKCWGCALCGIPVCETCHRTGHVCEACDNLTRIGVFARRRYVKQHPTFIAGFTGHDRVHDVALLLFGRTVRRELVVRGQPVQSSVSVTLNGGLRHTFRKWAQD